MRQTGDRETSKDEPKRRGMQRQNAGQGQKCPGGKMEHHIRHRQTATGEMPPQHQAQHFQKREAEQPREQPAITDQRS